MNARLKTLLICAAAVALPAPLFAQDLTPSGERILSDPTYLPLGGQIYGDTGFQYQDTGVTASNGSNTRNDEEVISQDLEYGLTNDITLEASDTYAWDGIKVTPGTGAPYERNSFGFTDPSFGVTWRALDERNRQPVDLDFSVSYAPNIISAANATPFSQGNVARGGDALDLRAALGWETRPFTVQGYVQDTRFGNATAGVIDGQVDTAAYWQPAIGISTQTRIGPRLSVNVNGSYAFRETESQYVTVGAGYPEFETVGDDGVLGAAVNYHFIPNRLVGSLGYQHTFYGEADVAYPFTPAADISRQRDGNGLTAQVRYVFP